MEIVVTINPRIHQSAQPISSTQTDVTPVLWILDGRMSDLEDFYRAFRAIASVDILPPQVEALSAITQLLKRTGAKRLAIAADGQPGVVNIGAIPLTLEYLQAQAHLLQTWNVEEIRLYSCDVAKGDRGWKFMQHFSHLTGASIAASAGNARSHASRLVS